VRNKLRVVPTKLRRIGILVVFCPTNDPSWSSIRRNGLIEKIAAEVLVPGIKFDNKNGILSGVKHVAGRSRLQDLANNGTIDSTVIIYGFCSYDATTGLPDPA